MQEAVLTVALSRSDSQYLSELLAGAGGVEGTGKGSAGADGGEGSAEGAAAGSTARRAPAVLLPALREDMRAGAPALPGATSGSSRGDAGSDADAGGGGGVACSAADLGGAAAAAAQRFASSRPYLACCVRLSGEKEPHRFVELVEALSVMPGGLDGVTPLLVAGTTDDEYARSLKVCIL
jgi:hypothetical protein